VAGARGPAQEVAYLVAGVTAGQPLVDVALAGLVQGDLPLTEPVQEAGRGVDIHVGLAAATQVVDLYTSGVAAATGPTASHRRRRLPRVNASLCCYGNESAQEFGRVTRVGHRHRRTL